MAEKTPKYRTEIQQMMFVSGETGEPSIEVTSLVEQIVLQQVQEMVSLVAGLLVVLRRQQQLINIIV